MFKPSAVNAIDFYKADHRRQYPKGTQLVVSNWTPRSVAHAPKILGLDDKIVHFGTQAAIQYYLIDLWNETFFALPKDKAVQKHKRILDACLGPGAVPVDHMFALHERGYLPLSVRALPEGVAVNARVPMAVYSNTEDDFFWLTNFIESVMSNLKWQPMTSASIARKYRLLFSRSALQSGGDLDFVKFQGHDFSFRGMGMLESSMGSGGGHMVFFVGTDTVPAIEWLEYYYDADCEKELIGCSVPATEHSVMSMGTEENELETFRRLITEVYPNGIVSIVSDTWDYWQVVTKFVPALKKEILARKGGFPIDRVVIRPDSGDPVKIICGDPDAPKDSPEYKGTIQCFWDTFGGTTDGKGYKTVDPHIGCIYGDSITLTRAEQINRYLREKGFASTNWVAGIGSYTYQFNTRDTYGFAMKATAGRVNGKFREIYKLPKTDSGVKKSARGLVAVVINDRGEYELRDQVSQELFENNELKEVFRNGKLLVRQSLGQVRARAEAGINQEIAAWRSAKLQS